MSVTIAYDVTGANYDHAPKGHQLALYITGSGGVPATAAQRRANPGAVLIDQTPVSGQWNATADVDDVERGAVRLDEIAGRAKQRFAAFREGRRPGQRMPAVYFSASMVHDVVNALVDGGVREGVGLFIAAWGTTQVAASEIIAMSAAPFPVIGYQIKNAGLFDIDVFSTEWLNHRSGGKAATVEAPPGQWKNPVEWEWETCNIIGLGLDNRPHGFNLDTPSGKWHKSM